MDCKQLQQCLDDMLDGALPNGEQRLAEQHLAGCGDCRQQLAQIQTLRHALRGLPVPPPSADFTQRVLQATYRPRRRQQALLGGLITAMAASLVIWVSVTVMQPTRSPTGINDIVMAVSETREVKLVFNAPEHFPKVTLRLELSGNIELTGYAGQRDLEWQTALKKGSNTLVLPITATGYGPARVIARLKHQGKIRTFQIPVKVNNSGARLSPELGTVTIRT